MNIEGLSEATLEKFVDRGFVKNYGDIFRLDRYYEQLVQMEGFGEKSYESYMKFYDAGAERYYSRVAYKFDKHGNITAECSYNTSTLYYDMATGKEYKKGKVLSKTYLDANRNKISKSKYKKTLNQTNKKKNVKMHSITKSNIKKYLK